MERKKNPSAFSNLEAYSKAPKAVLSKGVRTVGSPGLSPQHRFSLNSYQEYTELMRDAVQDSFVSLAVLMRFDLGLSVSPAPL